MDKGKIVEQGNHLELINLDGIYKNYMNYNIVKHFKKYHENYYTCSWNGNKIKS